jgi:hypothetical protein
MAKWIFQVHFNMILFYKNNKMNKNTFPLFEFRDKKLDLAKFEEELGFKFPPIYRAFLSNFNSEPKKQLVYLKRTEKEKNFIDDDFRVISLLAYSSSDKNPISHEDDELNFETFKSINSLLKFCVPEDDGIKDMIFISDHGSSDALLVGIGNHNQDKIFIYSEFNDENDEGIIFFAENIFDFLSKCQIVEFHLNKHSYGQIRKVENNKLYKNWGEDFWRIREDDNT